MNELEAISSQSRETCLDKNYATTSKGEQYCIMNAIANEYYNYYYKTTINCLSPRVKT